jgi:type IV pilus assembly protein PilC
MAEFLVKVADERGRVSEQVESARSEGELRDRYIQQGYLVYSVKQKGLTLGGGVPVRRKKVKQDAFIIFNQQFLTLIRAGLPILQALDLLMRRQRNAYFRSLLTNVHQRVKSGELLSDSFEAQGVFPKIYTTTILAGEKSGNLEEVLARYVSFQRLVLSFRKKLVASLIYPAVLVCGLIGLLTFMFTFVVPRFGELYNQLGQNLPPLTVFMLAVGNAVQKYFPIIVLGIVAAIVFLWNWRKTESGSRQIDAVRMRLPILGDIWLKYQVSVFVRMLGTLLSGGLPLVPSLQTAGDSMTSRSLARGVINATQRVKEGQPLYKTLEENTPIPELAIEMVEVGESTGALPQMLTSVAEFFEEDVQNALSAAMSLIEPLILIVMGIVVAFVLISLYLPIFTLGAGGVH